MSPCRTCGVWENSEHMFYSRYAGFDQWLPTAVLSTIQKCLNVKCHLAKVHIKFEFSQIFSRVPACTRISIYSNHYSHNIVTGNHFCISQIYINMQLVMMYHWLTNFIFLGYNQSDSRDSARRQTCWLVGAIACNIIFFQSFVPTNITCKPQQLVLITHEHVFYATCCLANNSGIDLQKWSVWQCKNSGSNNVLIQIPSQHYYFYSSHVVIFNK